MSFNQNFPFNFKPTSVTVTSSNYTVASNEYVFLSAEVTGSETLVIDGTTAMDAPSEDIIKVSHNLGGGSYNIPAGYFFEGTILNGAVDSLQVNSGAISIGPGAVVSTLGGPPSNLVGYLRRAGSGTQSNTFWLPPGTSITGTAKKTISRFLIP